MEKKDISLRAINDYAFTRKNPIREGREGESSARNSNYNSIKCIGLAQGMYFVRVETGNGSLREKVFIR